MGGRRRAITASFVALFALGFLLALVPAFRFWSWNRDDLNDGSNPAPPVAGASDAADRDAATLSGRPAPRLDSAVREETDAALPTAGPTGRVVDEHGNGVEGATVGLFPLLAPPVEGGPLLTPWSSMHAPPRRAAAATSDAQGAFRFEMDVPSGGWVLRADHPDRPQALLRFHRTNRLTVPVALRIVMEAGTAISGVVVDESGRGIAGARVRFAAVGDGGDLEPSFSDVSATTDLSGGFRVKSGPERAWNALATAEGHAPAALRGIRSGQRDLRFVLGIPGTLELTVVDASDSGPLAGAEVVAIGGTFTEAIGDLLAHEVRGRTDTTGTCVLPLAPGPVAYLSVRAPGHVLGVLLDGRRKDWGLSLDGEGSLLVTSEGTSRARVCLARSVTLIGSVRDPAGLGIEGAEIRQGFMGSFLQPAARSRADGSYRLEGVLPGKGGVLHVGKPGWALPFEQMLVLRAVPSDASGEVRQDFVLERVIVLRGRIVDGDGRGIQGAWIRLEGEVTPVFSPEVRSMVFSNTVTYTGADGAWTVEGQRDTRPHNGALPRGGFVVAGADGWAQTRSATFPVTPDRSIVVPTILLRRACVVTGVVFDAEGKPVPGARVEAESIPTDSDVGDRYHAETGAVGTFAIRDVSPRPLHLFASAPGSAGARKTVRLEREGQEARVEIRLRRATQVHGRVTGEGGASIVGAEVWTGGPAGPQGDEAYVPGSHGSTDTAGQFLLDDLPSGPVPLRVTAEGYRTRSAVAQGGGVPIEVVMTPLTDAEKARVAEIRSEVDRLEKEEYRTPDPAIRAALFQKREALEAESSRIAGG